MKKDLLALTACLCAVWAYGKVEFATPFAVALLVGGIYLIATGHPSGGYALAGVSALTGFVVMALVLAAVVKMNKGGMNSGIETA